MRERARAWAVALVAAWGAGACGERPDDPAPAEAPADAVAAGDRYLRALELLDIERRPDEAAALFRAIVDDSQAPAADRAKATIGLARAERLLGHGDAAEALLRDVVAKHRDLPHLVAQAQEELNALAGARTRFATGIVDLADAQFLDLDVGGVFASADPPAGGYAEVGRRGDEIVWLVPHDEAAEMRDALPALADMPWWRATTDAGRTAWVQRLPSERPAVLRFVVRMSGALPPLAAPADPFCIGSDDHVDVRFTPDARYTRYRIERRVGPDGAFLAAGELTEPPFVDRDVKPGVRYGYRIVGITSAGDQSFPATVQGTTRSHGVFTGTVELEGGRSDAASRFDFLTEETVATDGDLHFNASYGGASSVGFLDGWGRVVTAASHGDPPRSPWASSVSRRDHPHQIEAGRWFLLPLRGGGVARCRVSISAAWRVRLDYEVDPDGDTFAEAPRIDVTAVDGGAVVHVVILTRGFVVGSVEARDARADRPPEALPVTDGRAFDPLAVAGSLRHYTATGEDAFGRRSPAGTAVLNLLSPEPIDGTFQFHYQQGWSFDLQRVVDAADADVIFASCAGGISSITLAAPNGIVSLERALGSDRDPPSAGRLFEMVLGVDESAVRLGGEAQADSRSPLSDVSVLRTRNGGWARVAIVGRNAAAGGWTEYPATIRYTFNPREPDFASAGAETPSVVEGLRLAPGVVRTDAVSVIRRTRETARARGDAGTAGGIVPDSSSSQEVLFALDVHRDPAKASYSVVTGRRDVPAGAQPPKAYDLRYGAVDDRLEVRPDGSELVDLGEKAWDDLPTTLAGATRRHGRSAAASAGHAYLVRLVGGPKAVVRVTGLVAGDRVAFEWAALGDAGLVTSPSLTLPPALAQEIADRLGAEEAAAPAGPRDEPVSDAARATLARLRESRGYVRFGGIPLASAVEVVDRIGLRHEIDPALEEVAKKAVHIAQESPISTAEILDAVTHQVGVTWTVDEQGTVRVVPAPK